MNIVRQFRYVCNLVHASAANVSWRAIGCGAAAALAIYLGIDLILTARADELHVGHFLRHRTGLMIAANIAAIAGAGVCVQVARRQTDKRLSSHAYAVWLAVTVILMTQIAVTTTPGSKTQVFAQRQLSAPEIAER